MVSIESSLIVYFTEQGEKKRGARRSVSPQALTLNLFQAGFWCTVTFCKSKKGHRTRSLHFIAGKARILSEVTVAARHVVEAEGSKEAESVTRTFSRTGGTAGAITAEARDGYKQLLMYLLLQWVPSPCPCDHLLAAGIAYRSLSQPDHPAAPTEYCCVHLASCHVSLATDWLCSSEVRAPLATMSPWLTTLFANVVEWLFAELSVFL